MMDGHLTGFTEQNRAALRRLAAHGHQNIDLSSRPPKSLAAVLVLLFQEAGQLRVLLTTRAKHLRTHAGQTAFPGGKKDDEDRDLIYTALREAHEEVALPMDSTHIHILCTLEPFVSMHKLVVTPVVAFLTDVSVITALRPSQGEVSHIFSHPLEAILDPLLSKTEPLVPFGSEDWLYPDEFHNTNDIILSPLGNTPYRMHRFRSLGSPIKGLTSEVLIMTAEIAFASKVTYDHFAPGQPVDFKTVLARIVEDETRGTNSQFVS